MHVVIIKRGCREREGQFFLRSSNRSWPWSGSSSLLYIITVKNLFFSPPFSFLEKRRKKVLPLRGDEERGGKMKMGHGSPLIPHCRPPHAFWSFVFCCSIFLFLQPVRPQKIFKLIIWWDKYIWAHPVKCCTMMTKKLHENIQQQTASIRRSIGGDTGVHTTQRVVTQRVRKNTIQ